jgi:hypothetical protein
MYIKYVENEQDNQVDVSDLKPGTIYEADGASFLKLENSESIVLTYSNGDDCLYISDGTIEENQPITVLGHLVGIKVKRNG